MPRRTLRFVLFTAVAGIVIVTAGSYRAAAQSVDPDSWEDLVVRATLHEPFSPFSEIVYEWKTRGGSPIITMSRAHLGGFGRDTELVLVPPEEYTAYLEAIVVCEAMPTIGQADAPDEDSRFAVVDISSDEGSTTLLLDDQALMGPCWSALTAPADERITMPIYRNPFWIEGEYGMLRADADVSARVFIDGVDTGEVTPVSEIRLEPGSHVVGWVAESTGVAREETVTIEAGRTTTIAVRFE